MITLRSGNCKEVLLNLEVGAVICDPPYGLEFMGKGWDRLDLKGSEEPQKMMQTWHHEWLSVAYGSLRPGGVIKAFGGTRTFHRLAAAMEDAGFTDIHLEAWGYGSGFPKSMDVSKQLDGVLGKQSKGFKTAGDDGRAAEFHQNLNLRSDYGYKYTPVSLDGQQWSGWGTALKPAWEPVVVGRKPQ
jgi:hypothetical protein